MAKTTIGLDLSLTGTGVVILKGGKLVDQTVIKSKPLGLTPRNEIERLLSIVAEVDKYILKYSPKMIAIEGLAFGIVKTTSIMQLAGLNYLTRERIINCDIDFIIVAPSTLKKFATGKGNGPKDLVMLELYKRYGESFTNNNAADAYGLAMMAYELISKNKIPAFQEETLKVIRKQIQ